MKIKGCLKRLFVRIKLRFESKKKRFDRELQEACNKEADAMEEIMTRRALFGMDGTIDSFTTTEEDGHPPSDADSVRIGSFERLEISDADMPDEDIDPRFVANRLGIGSSRSFEKPLLDRQEDAETGSSTAVSEQFLGTPRDNDNVEDEDQPSRSALYGFAFECSTWEGPESLRIDWSEGKRKGKATEADIEEARMMKQWLEHVQNGKVMPGFEEARRFLAVMRGRAWTF